MVVALCVWLCQGACTDSSGGPDTFSVDGAEVASVEADCCVADADVSEILDSEQGEDIDVHVVEVGPKPSLYTAWPNPDSVANSDPWIAAHHDQLEVMRPRFLVINFANGRGTGGLDELLSDSAFTAVGITEKAQAFLYMLREASRYQPRLDPNAPAFLEPELVKVVDLQDDNGHANSDAFPRGQLIAGTPGYHTVGYYELFSEAFAPHWGYEEDGVYLTLGEIIDRGYVHEVILMANQVDGKESNPPDQVTANILEVAMVAQAYDEGFAALSGEFIKNGISAERQGADMAFATPHDHNSMPWTGRSLRIYFMNANRGEGCLLHSLGHEFEFRYNEAAVHSPGTLYHGISPHPYLQPLFRSFADFDMDSRYDVAFSSLYAGGDDYSYTDCDPDGVCDTLVHPQGTITPYRPNCGNTHYPPGATHGYDYGPVASVLSGCEGFGQPGAVAEPFSAALWSDITANPDLNGDCGGNFLMFWFQNMPGLGNEARVDEVPMKNWWPFMYY
jgi:hypothetical protein